MDGLRKLRRDNVGVQEGGQVFKANYPVWFLICVLGVIAIVAIGLMAEKTGGPNYILTLYLSYSAIALVMLRGFTYTKDEILPFRTFANPGPIILCVCEIVMAAAIIFFGACAGKTKEIVIFVITFILLTYLLSHFSLSYNPFENNVKYSKYRTIYRNNENKIIIKESRSFVIVLENTGTETVSLHEASIKRCVLVESSSGTVSHRPYDVNFLKKSVKFSLPKDVNFLPGQTITIIPGTEKHQSDTNAIAIPGFRCFGLDSGERITTKMAIKNKDIAEMEEFFTLNRKSDERREFTNVREVINTEEGLKTVMIK